MKFSRLLEYSIIPEWSSYYVDYRYLKKIVKSLKISISSTSSEISESFLGGFEGYKELSIEISAESNKVNIFYIEKLGSIHKEIDSMISYIYNLRRVSSLNELEAKSLLNMKEINDDQNRATSMQRAFTELYQRVIWLESYCEFNYIGLLKIIVKSQTEEHKEDIERMEFTKWNKDLKKVKDDICEVIANEFFNGDLEKAKKIVQETKRFKTFDIGLIGFCFGIWSIFLPILGYVVMLSNLEQTYMSLYFYRLLFMSGFSVINFAGVIYRLEVHKINWLYIFQVSLSRKTSYLTCLSSGVFIITFSLVFQVFHICTSLYSPILFPNSTLFITLGIILLIILCPFNYFHRDSRLEAFYLILNLIIAPFGSIRFKNYMFGSWTTSLSVCFRDIYNTIFFIASSSFLTNNFDQVTEFGLFFVSILPFLWRILQNIKRVLMKKTSFNRQFLNFFRYFISISLSATAYLGYYDQFWWAGSFILGISLTSIIDVTQDWQIEIFQMKNSTLFSFNFLIFSIISNFLLRFPGFFTLMPISVFQNSYVNNEILLTACAVLELLRRSIWSVIRIEREQRNNDENFRDIHYIPVTFNKF